MISTARCCVQRMISCLGHIIGGSQVYASRNQNQMFVAIAHDGSCSPAYHRRNLPPEIRPPWQGASKKSLLMAIICSTLTGPSMRAASWAAMHYKPLMSGRGRPQVTPRCATLIGPATCKLGILALPGVVWNIQLTETLASPGAQLGA